MWFLNTPRMVSPEAALPGRPVGIALPERHFVLGTPMTLAPACDVAVFGMGCFWGAERLFWTLPGVRSTSVGYAGGYTPNPTYKEVCTGATGHTEVVRVLFDPAATSFDSLLRVYWESHDPTQGMQQGNDVGTQYRSWIGVSDAVQRGQAERSRTEYGRALTAGGYGPITTEIAPAGAYYPAEDYHQQYLAKNPGGYCGIGGTGVSCPAGITRG